MTDQRLATEPTGRVVGVDGCGGGWFAVWPTDDDDHQGLQSDLYADLSALFAAATVKVADADREVEQKDVAEIREATIDQGYEEGMRNAGSWPFEA